MSLHPWTRIIATANKIHNVDLCNAFMSPIAIFNQRRQLLLRYTAPAPPPPACLIKTHKMRKNFWNISE